MAVIASLLILVGCTAKTPGVQLPNTSEPSPDSSSDYQSDSIDMSEQAEMMKYYEYLNSVPTITLFMSSGDDSQGFNDEVMSAFAISNAIAKDSNYDFKNGVDGLESFAIFLLDRRLKALDKIKASSFAQTMTP